MANTASIAAPPNITQNKSKTGVIAAAAVGAKLKTTATAVVTAVVGKATRVNWSKGVNKRKMDQAIRDWDEKTGGRRDSNGEVIDSVLQFCTSIGIQRHSFQKHVHGNHKKRRTTTNGVRNRPLFSKSDQKFMTDTIAL